MNELRALEPCCGEEGREWANIRPASCIRGDKLLHVHPDIVLDFTSLPFRNGQFDQIFFDPPHLIRGDRTGFLNPKYLKFGRWNPSRMGDCTLQVNEEFHRVGRAGARLFVKILHGKDRRVTKLDDLDWFTSWDLADIKFRPSSVGWSTCLTVNAEFVRRDL